MASIRLVGRKFNAEMRLGAAIPRQTAGGAVYGEQTRPGDVAMTTYEGDALIKMDVPVLFDSWQGGKADQWPRVKQLLALSQGSGGNPPPVFTLQGPILNAGRRFQMEPPDWSDTPSPIGRNGKLYRQAMVLKLIEFQNPDTLRFRATSQGTFSASEQIRLSKSESLVQVCAWFYRDAGRAKQVGEANGIRDIRKKLPVGRVLTMPSEDWVGFRRGDDIG